MSETRDDFVVSFKPHVGYDSPLVIVKAATAAEIADKIGSMEAIGLFAIVGKADTDLKGAFNVGAVLGGTPVQHPSSVPTTGYAPPVPQRADYAPQGAPAGPPGLVAPTCPHSPQYGPKLYKTGTNARGTWQAWMCPTPKGTQGQCPPEWIK